MNSDEKLVSGGCGCGAIRYEATGEPFWVGHCHCQSCRNYTGAPMVTFLKSSRQLYTSSSNVGRGFCNQSGTPLSWEGSSSLPERGEIVELYISTFDDPERFKPANHLWYDEKIE